MQSTTSEVHPVEVVEVRLDGIPLGEEGVPRQDRLRGFVLEPPPQGWGLAGDDDRGPTAGVIWSVSPGAGVVPGPVVGGPGPPVRSS